MTKQSLQLSVGRALAISAPMFLIILFFLSGGNFAAFADWKYALAFTTIALFTGTIFYLMIRTGKTDRLRAIVFITMAILFCISFMTNLTQLRGTVMYSSNQIYSNEIPFCHIVTTAVIIPMAIKQTIIFPGSIFGGFAAISSMLVIVLGAMIALGRGFCSWGCFYGGWDDGTSRILKKPVIKKVNRGFRWFSFAVFIGFAIASALELSPVYCDWMCPFKAVTEFEQITSNTVLIKTIIFWSLFIGLVIVLPILTKKRIQCATFCPMGALMSLSNKINIFKVSINKDKCIGCHLCEKVCPTLSIGKKDIEKGRASFTCTKCGKCIDACPKQAITFHIAGTRLPGTSAAANPAISAAANPAISAAATPTATGTSAISCASSVSSIPASGKLSPQRTLFLYAAFSFMIILNGGSMVNGLLRIITLITTGHIL